MNRPLDMITYSKDGRNYLLLANNRRGVMKLSTNSAGDAQAITQPVQGTQGVGYDTIASLKGVIQMDKLDDGHAVILVQDPAGHSTWRQWSCREPVFRRREPIGQRGRTPGSLVARNASAREDRRDPAATHARVQIDSCAREIMIDGLDPAALASAQQAMPSASRWASLCPVSVPPEPGRSGRAAEPILGSYRVEGSTLRFTARYPLDQPGYQALIDETLLKPADRRHSGSRPADAATGD